MEEWRDIPGYEGLYKASNLGQIKTLNYKRTGKEAILLQHSRPKGYLFVELWKDKKGKNMGVQILVWSAFNGPIPEGMQVNHINEDKTDNRLENLNLMTPKENCNWGTRNKRIGKLNLNHPKKSKWVIRLSENNEILHFYPSVMEASRETGVNFRNISSCCLGRRNIAGGYKWCYAS